MSSISFDIYMLVLSCILFLKPTEKSLLYLQISLHFCTYIWLSLFPLYLFFCILKFSFAIIFSAYNILRIFFSNTTFVIKSVYHCCRIYFFYLILTKDLKKTITKYGVRLFRYFLTYIVPFRKSVSV